MRTRKRKRILSNYNNTLCISFAGPLPGEYLEENRQLPVSEQRATGSRITAYHVQALPLNSRGLGSLRGRLVMDTARLL